MKQSSYSGSNSKKPKGKLAKVEYPLRSQKVHLLRGPTRQVRREHLQPQLCSLQLAAEEVIRHLVLEALTSGLLTATRQVLDSEGLLRLLRRSRTCPL